MSAIVIPDELLAEARSYLDITWEDEGTDEKLRGQIRRGIAYIADKTGVEKSASAFMGTSGNDRAQALLFNYLLYDRSGALNDFVENYRSELIALRLKKEVERYAAKPEA